MSKAKSVSFNGRTYYQENGKYFRTNSRTGHRLLHRDVWEAYRGTIPDKHEIHHRYPDDYATTDPDRLECMLKALHLSLHHKGKTISPAQREAARVSSTGRPASPKALAALRLGAKVPWTIERRIASSTQRKGKKRTAEECAAISAGHQGKKRSPEHRAAIKAGLQAYFERKRLTTKSLRSKLPQD
jgi:hypothetical protein